MYINFKFLLIIVFVISTKYSSGQKDELIQNSFNAGNYAKTILLLNKKCKIDSQEKNWYKWILGKRDLYRCLLILDSINAIKIQLNDCKKVLKKEEITDPIIISHYQLLEGKFLMLNGEGDVAINFFQKSYLNAIKSKKATKDELVDIYTILYGYYREINDLKNCQKYASLITEIIQKYELEISSYELNLAYSTLIHRNIDLAMEQDKNAIIGSVKENENYLNSGLKHSINNRFFRDKLYYHMGIFYEFIFYWTNDKVYWNEALRYFNKIIRNTNYKNKGVQSLATNALYRIAVLYSDIDEPNLFLKYYKKVAPFLDEKYYKGKRVRPLEAKKNSSSFNAKNNNLMITLNYFKIKVLMKLYKKTKKLKYYKNAFSTINYSSDLCMRIVENYKFNSPLKVQRRIENLPFEKGISLAYFLYKKTGKIYYKRKIFEFAENNKYSDIIKSYLNSNTKSTRTNNPKHTFLLSNLSVNRIKRQCAEKDCLIEYTFDADSNLYAIYFTQKQFDIIRIDVNVSVLKNKIIAFRNSIQVSDNSEYKKLGYEIYKILLDPVLRRTSSTINKLTIIPEKIISFVPFDGLLYKDCKLISKDYRNLPYVIKKYQISQLLSVRINNYLEEPHNDIKSSRILGFSPGNIEGLSNLPFSKKGLNYLKENYSGHYLADNRATVAAFMKYAPKYSIIYLGTHAKGSIDNSKDAKIFLCNSEKKNVLTLNDIYLMNLNADLIILSACETSLGEYQYGEGIMNFDRVFMFAGSKSVMSTLWQIDDQANYEVLKRFTKNLENGKTKSKALQLAKLEMLHSAKSSDDANPLYWSGYKLIGSDQTLMLDSKHLFTPFRYIVTIVIFILIGAFFFFKSKKS